MNFSPQAKERLARQREKYFSSLSAKKMRIQDCWSQIQAAGWNTDRLNTLKTEVHRISGSAGSYGLISLGDAAQNLDRELALETEMSSLTFNIGELVAILLNAFDEAMVSKVLPSAQLH